MRACAASSSRSSVDREIFALALPALGALALDPLLGLIDTAFVGRLGVSAIAGVGLSTIILNIAFSVFNFLCISLTPLVAEALARDASADAASRTIAAGILLALAIGTACMLVLLARATPLVVALGATSDTLAPAVRYLRARALATPFALMSLVANGALRGFKDLRTPFVVAAVANMLNVVLDVVLIFRCGLGVAGAAYATSLSQIFAVAVMLYCLVSAGRLRVRHLLRMPSASILSPMLGAGVMLTLRTLSLLGTIAYATATAATSGVVSLAAYELCRQLWIFKATVMDMFAAAAQALVASAMAQRRKSYARKVAVRAVQLSLALGCVLGLAEILAGERLPAMFTASAEVKKVAAGCIKVAAVCAPLNGCVFALDGVLTACRDYRYMALGIMAACAVTCAVLWGVRVAGGNVNLVWAGLNLLMVGRGAVLAYRFMMKEGPIPRIADVQEER